MPLVLTRRRRRFGSRKAAAFLPRATRPGPRRTTRGDTVRCALWARYPVDPSSPLTLFISPAVCSPAGGVQGFNPGPLGRKAAAFRLPKLLLLIKVSVVGR